MVLVVVVVIGPMEAGSMWEEEVIKAIKASVVTLQTLQQQERQALEALVRDTHLIRPTQHHKA